MKSLRISLKPLFAVLPLLIVAACATKAPVKKQEAIFFPPPPDQPRVQYLTSIGSEGDLNPGKKIDTLIGAARVRRPIWKPYGMVAKKNTLYVCDTMPKNVSVIDLAKGKISYIRPEGRGLLKMPINAAVDDNGTLYVTDTARQQVVIFDKEHNFIGEMGKPGEMKPCGITLDAKRLYLTDLSNHCVRVYAKASKEVLFTIPRDTNDHKAKLFSPTNVTLDEKGNIYVCDTGAFAIKVYDADGKFLRMIGDVGLVPGRFALPKGIGVDRENRIYVVDAATGVVQMFDPEGQLLMYFGEPKSSGKAGLYLPAGLAIDYDNVGQFQKYAAPGYKVQFIIYVTNQAGPNKISVFGFMRKG
jgi:sugar lactone lactonase YvrE